MGIPSFFRKIIKQYPETHFWDDNVLTEYLYFDFNCLIYHCLHKIDKDLSVQKYEAELIKQVIAYTRHIIVDIVKPTKQVVIALDGPAPRAKMVQQRARRFKRKIDQGFKEYLRHKYELPPVDEWDSRKISPGTLFMERLAKELKAAITSGSFTPANLDSNTGSNPGPTGFEILFSDSNHPGEGEHKVIPLIKALEPDASVCLYGLDADLIVLAMATHKNQILILREPLDSEIERAVYAHHEFLYLSIDIIRQSFLVDLSVSMTLPASRGPLNEIRVFEDYVFLTFLGGNDFVKPISFLNIKEGGLNIMMEIYKRLLPEQEDYLVVWRNDSPTINIPFFTDVIKDLTQQEAKKMNIKQRQINMRRAGTSTDPDREERESAMTPYQIELSRFEHLPFYDRDHPLFDQFDPLIRSIDYSKPLPEWREQYYYHFFGFEVQNQAEYNANRRKVAMDYIKSLIFTLKYYLVGIPSWSWYYPHRVAPLVSDVEFILRRFDREEFKYDQGKPMPPLTQLMMIMPPDAAYLLPAEYAALMQAPELVSAYPNEFAIDALAGLKYIYSEPILPEVNERLLREKIRAISERLGASDKRRNKINEHMFKCSF